MNKLKLVTLLLLHGLSFYFNKIEGQIPKEKNLSEFGQTEFTPTLEHKLTKGKNSVYCSSFLYAWNEVRSDLKFPLQIDSSFKDLRQINNSTSFENTLNQNEYLVKKEINKNSIKFISEFFKSLPFEEKLIQNDHLLFNNEKIPAFGFYGQRKHPIEIIYYKNDNDFIIKISLKEKQHELLLYLPETSYSSMREIIDDISAKKNIGLTERKDEQMGWKYLLTHFDIVNIPIIGFNIKANYTTIEGNSFKSNNSLYEINSAQQQVGFFLNEKGVEVSSRTELDILFSEPMEGGKPKKLIFDKPFFVMLKRVDSSNPYFGLWIDNAELMTH